MRLRTLGWSALIVVPLLVCAGHLHGKRAASAETVREVNRCLSLVRIATSRRRRNADEQRERHGAAGRRLGGASRSPGNLPRSA